MRFRRATCLLIAFVSSACAAALVHAAPADDQYAVAAGNYSRGRWDLAAKEFDTFLKSAPDHPRAPLAKFFLGESLVQLGRFGEAKPYFDEFYEADPTNRFAPQALFRRGEAAYLTGDRKAAREHLALFRERYPQDKLNAYALPYLGDLALTAEDAPEAHKLYVEALKQFGETPLADQCRFGLARSLEMQKRYDDAAKFFQFLVDKPNSPLGDDALVQLGHLRYRQGKHDDAIKTFALLAEKFPTSDMQPYANYWTGMANVAKGDWDGAIASLDKVASLPAEHPLATAARFQLAEGLRQQHQLDKAQEEYAKLLADAASSPWADDAARGEIRIALEKGDDERAGTLAAEFITKYPKSPLRFDVRSQLGRALVKQQKFAEAIAELEPLVAEIEKLDARQTGIASLDAEVSKGSLPEGAELTALKSSTRLLLALAQVGGAKFNDALATLGRLPPEAEEEVALSAGIQATKATALIGLKKHSEAIAPLRKYLELEPNGPDAAKTRAQLAVALVEAGKPDEARKAYEEYAAQHKDHADFYPTTLYLAETAFAAGDKAWSGELFATLSADDVPADLRAKGLSGKAWSELTGENTQASAETFEKLLSDFPDSPLAPEAALARAGALEKLNEPNGALATYQLIIEKYPNSKQMPQALNRAAQLYDRLEQNEEAAALFARLVKEYPTEPDLHAVLYRWAWVLVDSNKPDEAQAVFTRLNMDFKQSPFWADATYRLAERASLDGNYDRVKELTAEILKSKPTASVAAHALFLQGQSAARVGKWSEVAAPMEELLKQHAESPLRVSADYWIAEALYRQEKFAESAERFAHLSQKVQGRSEGWLAMVPLRRAQVLAQDKKWAAAYAMAAPIAEQFPNFSQQYEVDYLLGRCLASQAKFSDARTAYERVTNSPQGRRTETAAMAEWMIGETYMHQKDYDSAIRAYSRVELLYDFPQWQAAALLQAGKCYEAKSEWSQAVERYSLLLKQFGDTTFAPEAARLLRVAQEKASVAAPTRTSPSEAVRPAGRESE